MAFKLSAMIATPSANTSSPNSSKSGGLVSDIVDKIKSGYRNKVAGAGSKGANDLGSLTDGSMSAKKGGTVKKSGFIKVHKGEKILNKKQSRKYSSSKRA